MSVSERPGVYTSYEVSGGLHGESGGGAVGLAAAAGSGTAGTVVAVTNYAAAVSAFSSGNLLKLTEILLKNGASVVYCCPVDNGDYATAFAALMEIPEVKFMVCDSRTASVHAAMKAAIAAADERCKYRIGVVESEDSTRAALIADAEALMSERMLLVSHHETSGTAGAVAAAVCGALAGESDPAVPLNGAALQGLSAVGNNFSDADLTLLVRGGVLPLETLGGQLSIIRGITTRSQSGGVSDGTWREVNTVRIVDTVLPGIRDALRADFSRVKNTAQTRGAIRTRTVIELENYLRREIIDSYSDVSVAAEESDPTVCRVSFRFTVAPGLNIIELSAHITV
jgi:phage tail sheath gpL-like